MYKSLITQKLFFFLLDFLLILGSFVVAFFLRLGSFSRTDFPFEQYFENAFLITPIWLLILIWSGKYELREKKSSEMIRIVSLSALTSVMIFVLVFFFRREAFFSRLIVAYIFIFGTLFGMLSYVLERKWEKWKTKQKKGIVRVLIIGANRVAVEIIEKFQKTSSRHVPVSILAPFGSHHKELQGVPVLGKLDALERVIDQEKIDEIILCDGVEQMMNLLSFAEGRFLSFRVAPDILGVFRKNILPDQLSGKTLLSLQPSPLFGWGQLWKRIFDIAISFLLISIFLPIFFIQKIGKGSQPLFQKEDRIGSRGKKFQMFSYATTSRSFFRHIPNVINIFKGDMSFVGARPAFPKQWESLSAHYKRRMVLRPGMLGPWQLKKINGHADDFEIMCRDDISYILNWSFWGDILITINCCAELLKNLGSRKSKVKSF